MNIEQLIINTNASINTRWHNSIRLNLCLSRWSQTFFNRTFCHIVTFIKCVSACLSTTKWEHRMMMIYDHEFENIVPTQPSLLPFVLFPSRKYILNSFVLNFSVCHTQSSSRYIICFSISCRWPWACMLIPPYQSL